MNKKECGNGHIYDADIHDSCPYCKNRKGTIVFPPSPLRNDGSEATIPAEQPLQPLPPPEPVRPEEETLSVMQELCGLDPVAGWLVGVGGCMTGRACELKARANRIGRSERMDVRLPDDRTVSWEDQACIDYDRMTDVCTLIPGRFVNTVYLNGEAIYAARSLKAYDRMLFGRTEMMFIPFCGEQFRWPTEREVPEEENPEKSIPEELLPGKSLYEDGTERKSGMCMTEGGEIVDP